MERNSVEEICLFIRDEETSRYMFNAEALKALGIDLVELRQRGYPLKEQAKEFVQCPNGYSD